jgi:hypothetical protein
LPLPFPLQKNHLISEIIPLFQLFPASIALADNLPPLRKITSLQPFNFLTCSPEVVSSSITRQVLYYSNQKTPRLAFFLSLEFYFQPFFLFLSQLAIKNPPITNAVPEICALQERAIQKSRARLKAKKIYKNPPRIKATPPTISRFQEIITTAKRMSAGILCIKSASRVCQKFSPVSKTSSDIRNRKATKMMDNILGVQKRNLLTFLSMQIILLIKQVYSGNIACI